MPLRVAKKANDVGWKALVEHRLPSSGDPRVATGVDAVGRSTIAFWAMSNYKEIDDFLTEDCQGKFVDKTWFMGLFGKVVYTPTGEKVEGGFRYFACSAQSVIEVFNRGDMATMLRMPFAFDEDGSPDTSSVLISLHYTKSGSVVAMQVQEYQNSEPIPVTPVVLLEGPQAQAIIAQVMELDQSN